MSGTLEPPRWRIVNWRKKYPDKHDMLASISPLSKYDHQWFIVDMFHLRPDWRDPQYPEDEWMVKWHHTNSEFCYYKTFKTRREALRHFGSICRDYWAMAVARYEEKQELAQFMGEDR